MDNTLYDNNNFEFENIINILQNLRYLMISAKYNQCFVLNTFCEN